MTRAPLPASAPLSLSLSLRPETLAICRVAAGAPPPSWLDWEDALTAAVRRDNELSIICPMARLPQPLPPGLVVEPDWRAFQVAGPLDFSLVGILADLSGRLAAAEISVFALSTYDTDLLLVRGHDLAAAVAALCPPHRLDQPD